MNADPRPKRCTVKKSEYQRIVREQIAEGEPQTRARVEGMVWERWGKRPNNNWITQRSPRRHLVVKFGRNTIEAAAESWLAALDLIEFGRRG